MVMLVAGVTVARWSFWTLGQYFTSGEGQPGPARGDAGPYRALRHPGYAGGLLAMIGFGVTVRELAQLRRIAVLGR